MSSLSCPRLGWGGGGVNAWRGWGKGRSPLPNARMRAKDPRQTLPPTPGESRCVGSTGGPSQPEKGAGSQVQGLQPRQNGLVPSLPQTWSPAPGPYALRQVPSSISELSWRRQPRWVQSSGARLMGEGDWGPAPTHSGWGCRGGRAFLPGEVTARLGYSYQTSEVATPLPFPRNLTPEGKAVGLLLPHLLAESLRTTFEEPPHDLKGSQAGGEGLRPQGTLHLAPRFGSGQGPLCAQALEARVP